MSKLAATLDNVLEHESDAQNRLDAKLAARSAVANEHDRNTLGHASAREAMERAREAVERSRRDLERLDAELLPFFRDVELASRETEKARKALATEVGITVPQHAWPLLEPPSKMSYKGTLLRSTTDSMDADAAVATVVETSVEELELGDDEEIKGVTAAIYDKYRHRWDLEDVAKATLGTERRAAEGGIPKFEMKRCKNHFVYQRVVEGLTQIYVAAKTPSDRRAGRNGERVLRRLDEEAREKRGEPWTRGNK